MCTKIFDTACHCTKIQEDIYRLQEWSNVWNLYFNVTKCQVMHLGRKKEETDYKMTVSEDRYESIVSIVIFDRSHL